MSEFGGASLLKDAVARPAAYVDGIGKEPDSLRINGLSTPNTAGRGMQNTNFFDIAHLPMVSGEWYVGNGADTSRDNQSNNLPATESTGTPDTVEFQTNSQPNHGDFSHGIDLDMGLPHLTEEEQLEYNALLGVGLTNKPGAEDGERVVVEEARPRFDVLPQPTEDRTTLSNLWCSDGQNTTAHGHADNPSSQSDTTHDTPLSAVLSELASEERPQPETNDSLPNNHVSKDWTLIESDGAGVGGNRGQ